ACESETRLKAMLSLARCELPIMPGGMDQDPWLLNCVNGTIDLKTCRLREHRQDDLITNLCPTAFNPDAECPVLLKTLEVVFAGDRDLIRYVQTFCGYCLSGDVREHAIPIAYGSGSNGKTLLFNTLMAVMGKGYAGPVPPELLIETFGQQHPTLKAQ